MSNELAFQLDLVVRLLLAALLGALIGLERELHDHPAGMRTHLLVAVGSATFTVLSIHAFAAPGADPARIAAQVRQLGSERTPDGRHRVDLELRGRNAESVARILRELDAIEGIAVGSTEPLVD